MSNRMIVVAVALAAICTSGCAMWRAGELPPVAGWPPSSKLGARSISLTLSGRLIFNGTEKDMAPASLKIWSDEAQKQFQQSNLFSDVKLGLEKTDLRAEVEVTDDGEGNLFLAFLTGLSLYLIPSSASDRLTLKTTLRNAAGDTVGEITKTETLTLWQQIFLIFVAPVKFPLTVMRETMSDLYRATLLEAAAKGYIQ